MRKPLDAAPAAALESAGETLTVVVSGSWSLEDERRPAWNALLRGRKARRVVVADRGLSGWDSSLALFVLDARQWSAGLGAELVIDSLPRALRDLVSLATTAAAAPPSPRASHLARLGLWAVAEWRRARAAAEFLGLCVLGLAHAARHPRRFRFREWLLQVQQTGAEGLPIVALVSFLVGTIIAFQAALQLRRFGADIFVVNLVDLSVAREMGVMNTAIILSGRTAAAFAAELGSMAAGEEIDALEMIGYSPVDFLVVPRILALVFVTPLLTLFADAVGMLGGAAVASSMLDIPVVTFFQLSKQVLALGDIRMGLIKSVVFGLIVAVCGCLRGMTCDRDTASVGRAATSAVVTSILWVVIADAVFGQFYSTRIG